MKEQYEAPKTEVILLEEEDIILTSTGGAAVDSPEGAGTFF